MELKDDTIVLCFETYRSPLYRTDFFKKVEIDSRDSDALQKDLKSILSVTSDLLRYLD